MVVDEVSALHGTTIVRILGSLQRAYPAGLVAYRIDRSFRHFGHNAPPQEVSIGTGGVAVADDVNYVRGLSSTTELGSGPLAARDLPLDAAVDDLVAGREVIVSYVRGRSISVLAWGGEAYYYTADVSALAGLVAIVNAMGLSFGDTISAGQPAPVPDTVVRTVTRVDAASLRLGPLAGPSTVLGLDRTLFSTQQTNAADIRTFSVHEVTSPRLQVRARPVDAAAATGRQLYFHGPAAAVALLEGRRLMLAPPGAEPTTVVATTVAIGAPAVAGMADLHRVTLAADIAYAGHPQEPDDASTVVLGTSSTPTKGRPRRRRSSAAATAAADSRRSSCPRRR